tara:strand:- start:261 stop:629 length:369 start_codon:yes stop_codon:yes gene_type:complete
MGTQALSYGVWRYHEKQLHVSVIDKVSQNIVYRMLSTVQFFTSLPSEYRHIVLDQLRQMDGTRFYVSFNQEQIFQDAIRDSDDKLITEKTSTTFFQTTCLIPLYTSTLLILINYEYISKIRV